jgi:SSS family transporter
MRPVDYLIIAVYFSLIILIGSCFSSSQKSLKDYFLGGRSVPWWAAMFSGIATIVSAISYLGAPGVAFKGDYTLHQYRLGLPIAMLVLGLVMLPYFYNNQRYSIYQYLEERFDLKTRLFTSALFILLKICFLGVAMYAPALVLREMFGLSIWYVVGFVGLFTTVYTLLGGIKAVIWTDSMQLIVLLSGLLVVALIAIGKTDGGLATVIELGQAKEKFRFFNFSWSLTEKYTFLGGLIGGAFFILTQFGTDQAELQRFLTTKTLKQSNIALMGTLVFTFAFGLFVFFIGTILFAFYTEFPEKGAMALPSSQVLPKFIIEELPVGIKGLLVASILSAAMSTISSVLNSVTTVGVTDFYNRFARNEASVGFARSITLILGITGIGLAGLMGSLGNILETAMRLNSFFGGPLVGVFLAGMLCRRTHANPAFIGLSVGFLFSIYLGFFTSISFLWYGAFTAIATATITVVLSLLIPDPRTGKTDLHALS